MRLAKQAAILVIAPLVRRNLVLIVEILYRLVERGLFTIFLALVHEVTKITLLLKQHYHHDGLVTILHFLLEIFFPLSRLLIFALYALTFLFAMCFLLVTRLAFFLVLGPC